jgi:hypothetical protein
VGAERERFSHVMSDQDDGLADLRLNAPELPVDLGARHRIERTKGFVHEQNWRISGQRAGDANALPLSAGKLIRPPF